MIESEILSTIPHKDPFLFLEKVLSFERGKSIEGIMKNSIDQDFYKGHFPEAPILPGVLLIEALAQAACFLFIKTINPPEKSKYYLGSLKFRFYNPAGPKDTIRLSILADKIVRTGAIFTAKASSEKNVFLEGKLGLMCKSYE